MLREILTEMAAIVAAKEAAGEPLIVGRGMNSPVQGQFSLTCADGRLIAGAAELITHAREALAELAPEAD
jgi:hypothetical protein